MESAPSINTDPISRKTRVRKAMEFMKRNLRFFVSEPQPYRQNYFLDTEKTDEEAALVQLIIAGFQDYHSSPVIVEDEVDGFDPDGNYHFHRDPL